MTTEITGHGDSVEVRYRNESGGEAAAIVVGESADSVRDRASEIVDNHDLKSKSEEDE